MLRWSAWSCWNTGLPGPSPDHRALRTHIAGLRRGLPELQQALLRDCGPMVCRRRRLCDRLRWRHGTRFWPSIRQHRLHRRQRLMYVRRWSLPSRHPRRLLWRSDRAHCRPPDHFWNGIIARNIPCLGVGFNGIVADDGGRSVFDPDHGRICRDKRTFDFDGHSGIGHISSCHADRRFAVALTAEQWYIVTFSRHVGRAAWSLQLPRCAQHHKSKQDQPQSVRCRHPVSGAGLRATLDCCLLIRHQVGVHGNGMDRDGDCICRPEESGVCRPEVNDVALGVSDHDRIVRHGPHRLIGRVNLCRIRWRMHGVLCQSQVRIGGQCHGGQVGH